MCNNNNNKTNIDKISLSYKLKKLELQISYCFHLGKFVKSQGVAFYRVNFLLLGEAPVPVHNEGHVMRNWPTF